MFVTGMHRIQLWISNYKNFSCLLCVAATYIFLSFNDFQVLGGLQCKSNTGSPPAQKTGRMDDEVERRSSFTPD